MRTPDGQKEKSLRKLVKLFVSRAKPLTAAKIAASLDCARPVAYCRLKDLKSMGVKFKISKVRDSLTGPPAIAYSLVVNGAAKKFLT